MSFLQILSEDISKWRSMVRAMKCPAHLVDDVVHDMYIKMSREKNPNRLMYDETSVNHFYIYMVLRGVYADTMKAEGKYILPDEVDANVISYDLDTEEDAAWERLYSLVRDEIVGFGPYGAKLCFSYFKTDKSLREIASESGISLTSIFNSQKQYKQHLYDRFLEDYEDLKNGDYNKL